MLSIPKDISAADIGQSSTENDNKAMTHHLLSLSIYFATQHKIH